jgi:hypothetical protein
MPRRLDNDFECDRGAQWDEHATESIAEARDHRTGFVLISIGSACLLWKLVEVYAKGVVT